MIYLRTVKSQQISLLDKLKMLYPDSSSNTLRSWISQGRVSVDGRTVKRSSTLLSDNQNIKVGTSRTHLYTGIQVLYEDDHLVVVIKPEGLLSVATAFDKQLTVHQILKNRFHKRRVFPVHRLDKETSGIMMFAYTEPARDKLKKMFHDHTIEREYVAVVMGMLTPRIGTWKSYLQEDANYFVKSNPCSGKLSITHYEVICQNLHKSVVVFRLETGRKNQIRVHASEAKHPILGDIKYGGKPSSRLFLHAKKLSFQHPITQKLLSFETELPEEFQL